MAKPRETDPMLEREILMAAIDALKTRTRLDIDLIPEPMHHTYRYDAALSVKSPHSRTASNFIVEIKPTLHSKNQIVLLKEHLKDAPAPLIIVTQYVTPGLLQACINLGISVIDMAGNAYIEAPGIYILIENQKSIEPAFLKDNTVDTLASPAALKLIFVLLISTQSNNAVLAETFRTLSQRAQISLGSTSQIIKTLVQQEFISKRNDGTMRLINTHKLIDFWLATYPTVLRPKLTSLQLSGNLPLRWWDDVDLSAFDALWGGETAYWLINHSLQPASQSIYVPAEHREDLTRQLVRKFQLRPDLHGSITILEQFWRPVQHDQAHDKRTINRSSRTVPELLICADMMTETDSRVQEATRALLQRIRHEDH